VGCVRFYLDLGMCSAHLFQLVLKVRVVVLVICERCCRGGDQARGDAWASVYVGTKGSKSTSPGTKGLLGREVFQVATRSSGDLNCRGAQSKELSSPCSILRVLTGFCRPPEWPGRSLGVVGRVHITFCFMFCVVWVHCRACYRLQGDACCAHMYCLEVVSLFYELSSVSRLTNH
jgi:hypothetical protein